MRHLSEQAAAATTDQFVERDLGSLNGRENAHLRHARARRRNSRSSATYRSDADIGIVMLRARRMFIRPSSRERLARTVGCWREGATLPTRFTMTDDCYKL
jgi:hypothetical protein